MRFKLFTVSLALLSIVSAAPIKNLKDDLKEIAEQTESQINEEKTRVNFTLAKLIVEKKVADRTEIENWRFFLDEWISRDDSWLQDARQLADFNEKLGNFAHIVPCSTRDKNLVGYTGGAFLNIEREFKDFMEQRYAVFQTAAAEKIQMAKDNGYTDISLDHAFQHFVLAERSNRYHYFNDLLSFLNRRK